MTHDYHDLIQLFNQSFLASFNTELVRGGDEPIYLPADAAHPHHRVIFARGFFASALHEIAHWTIAGVQRRQWEDYGYWYHPDGRDADTQAAFEAVEVKPQAIEWILSASCGFRFQVSCDNLSGVEPDRHAFTDKVRQQVVQYVSDASTSAALPVRAKQFSDTLRDFYGVAPLTPDTFTLPSQAKVKKMKVQDYEARILALIDEMVETASDDELFASGYLRGHVSLAAADCELEGVDEVSALKARVDASLNDNASELSPGDQRLVGALWDLLQQQVEKDA